MTFVANRIMFNTFIFFLFFHSRQYVHLSSNIHLSLFYSYVIHCVYFVLSLLQRPLYLVIGQSPGGHYLGHLKNNGLLLTSYLSSALITGCAMNCKGGVLYIQKHLVLKCPGNYQIHDICNKQETKEIQ